MGYTNNYTSFLYKVDKDNNYTLLKKIDLKVKTLNQAVKKAFKVFKVRGF